MEPLAVDRCGERRPRAGQWRPAESSGSGGVGALLAAARGAQHHDDQGPGADRAELAELFHLPSLMGPIGLEPSTFRTRLASKSRDCSGLVSVDVHCPEASWGR